MHGVVYFQIIGETNCGEFFSKSEVFCGYPNSVRRFPQESTQGRSCTVHVDLVDHPLKIRQKSKDGKGTNRSLGKVKMERYKLNAQTLEKGLWFPRLQDLQEEVN